MGKVTRKSRKAERREAQDFHPLAGILPADRRKRGVEVQVYAYAGRTPLWAGVHYLPEISAKGAFHLETQWRRWRRWYDNLPANVARHYPAKEGPQAADLLVLFPVSDPAARTAYRIPTA